MPDDLPQKPDNWWDDFKTIKLPIEDSFLLDTPVPHQEDEDELDAYEERERSRAKRLG